jgi:hypothetical protein
MFWLCPKSVIAPEKGKIGLVVGMASNNALMSHPPVNPAPGSATLARLALDPPALRPASQSARPGARLALRASRSRGSVPRVRATQQNAFWGDVARSLQPPEARKCGISL